jgi:hypothetical protein
MTLKLEQAIRQFKLAKTPETAANLITAHIRSRRISDLNVQNIRHCATLGDEVCGVIFPEDRNNYYGPNVDDVLAKMDKESRIRFAVWCARKVLHVWKAEDYHEYKPPIENSPRLSIEAAENWLEDPSKENFYLAVDAYRIGFSAIRHMSRFWRGSMESYNALQTATEAVNVLGQRSGGWMNAQKTAKSASKALGDVTPEELLVEYLMENIL